jgi:hypothetical protein
MIIVVTRYLIAFVPRDYMRRITIFCSCDNTEQPISVLDFPSEILSAWCLISRRCFVI